MNHFSKALILGCFSLVFLFGSVVPQVVPVKDQLLVIVLMVKNEEHVMQSTLQPFLDAKVDNYLILDTGSTDNTIPLTEQIFKDHGVGHGYIVQRPWVDFATSRNEAISCAEEKFPDAVFFLMIDAEWYVQNVEHLLEFCQEHQDDTGLSYLIRLGTAAHKNYINRLFRAHRGIRFEGVVHEYLNCGFCGRLPDDIYVYWCPSQQGVEKSHARWYRDRDLLLKEYERNPSDPRTVFYLAQTYECLEDIENARYWYEKRCLLPGWDEENGVAYFRLGCIYEGQNEWNKALCCYLKSYDIRPNRVEPLVRIARHFLQTREFSLAFLFAKTAVSIPFPSLETLFINTVMYEYDRYDALGIAAWYVGEYEIGEHAVRQALKYWPDATHLNSNLSLYLGRK